MPDEEEQYHIFHGVVPMYQPACACQRHLVVLTAMAPQCAECGTPYRAVHATGTLEVEYRAAHD